MQQAPVAVIGDALIDELRDGRSRVELVGGAGLNVAVGATRLGVPAVLIAMVGTDEPGAHIATFLDDHGVALLRSPAQRGTARAVSTRIDGEPTYVFNAAARARRVRFGPAERAAIERAPMTVVSCFPFDDGGQVDALADAVAGHPLVLDPNPREGMLHSRDDFVVGFERLAAGADLVKVGADDADLLYGLGLDGLMDRLRRIGARVVVGTAGGQGARVLADRIDVTVAAGAGDGPVVDTMGAGDAVLAALVADLVRERPDGPGRWRRVLEHAMDVAAATVRAQGALLRVPGRREGPGSGRMGT